MREAAAALKQQEKGRPLASAFKVVAKGTLKRKNEGNDNVRF